MNSHHINGPAPSAEDIHYRGLKMLVTIVNRPDGEKTTSFFRKKHFHFVLDCLAQGSAGSDILDWLGLGTSDKSIVTCVAPSIRIDAVLTELTEELKLNRKGKGIAFTIPLSGICMHKKENGTPIDERKWNINMQNEVDKMNNDITHSLVIAVVNQGYSEELVAVAKAAGAKGGTIINARRAGAEEAVKFFGISVQAEKEIVTILTSREKKSDIMDAISTSFGVTSQAHGIILSLPVDGVAGLG